MKSPSHLKRFAVVLVGTQNSGNVGSVARAMLNMGLERLILVHPECDPLGEESHRMARNSWPLVQKAAIVPDLKEALSGFHYAVASTARKGKRRGAFRSPRDLAPDLLKRPADEKIALVFGPEDRGLAAEQLALCQETLTIPTSDFKSLNLAQAVLVVGYELFLASHSIKPDPKEEKPVPLGKQEAMIADLQKVLLEIGYLDPQNPEHIMLDFRRLFGRAKLTDREIRILQGMTRQIRWATRNKKM